MSQMGKWPCQSTTTGLDNSTELRGENPSSSYRDMGSANLAAASPDHEDNTPPSWRAGGKKGAINGVSG